MTPDEIRKGVEELGAWFHQLDLGHGIFTKTASAGSEPVDHPRPTWEKVKAAIPADMSGKSVLDVGCNGGFYSIDMKRRGAARVFAVDSQRDQVNQASFAAEVLGLDIETQRLSVYDLDPIVHGQFDVVLALGLVYHCKHLIQALERLFTVTRELLILETAIYPRNLAPQSVTYNVGGIDRTLNGIAYVENPPDAKEAVFNWFLPSVEALVAMTKNVGFDTVDVYEGEHPERIIIAARKKEPFPDSTCLPYLNAELSFVDGPGRCEAGSRPTFTISCRNIGAARWQVGAKDWSPPKITASIQVYRSGGARPIKELHERFELPRDVLPGEAVEVKLTPHGPITEAGEFRVVFDLVSEHRAWFGDLGSKELEHGLTVV